ncbi:MULTISPECIES: IclR family transcriptional regulator [Thalassospira]|jgi:IclR family acetate operon transcriptional repressor|uniref:IclR family transcriptional regulator n=2 Tax=Thalassospira TaxID=168934 RepID=A0A367W5B3_9PROT|nr:MULTISPECIES: IclR family transcriptional regulator C-terminal domain-containing protein [Thalassospira]MDG4720978.1 IclR family transcriptional regulator C-terminal domain-containing protein [Thalassospira sp. FZY0004]RCK36635.1 IclR family transcriptional regulator [Thalassospira profundimaris]
MQQVQSLVRALSILNALAESDDGMTLTEIAQQVKLPPSTAHRLLTTMQHERYVSFDGERTLWFVGVQAFSVGNAFTKNRNLSQIARPYMRALMEDSGETVNLAVADGGEVIFLSQVECRKMMRALVTPGRRALMHCSGVGKALLAFLPEAELKSVVAKHGLPKITERTLVSEGALEKDLERSRKRGYALDDEEHAVGLRCVAGVVRDETGSPIAALSLSGPAARIPNDHIEQLGLKVRRVCADLSREYGGMPV